jgi:predicted GNAT family N-acyltransferase
MRDKNVDPMVVADQLGHTLDVNLNIYTQTSLERKIKALESLEASRAFVISAQSHRRSYYEHYFCRFSTRYEVNGC